jgi:hypothetical protein
VVMVELVMVYQEQVRTEQKILVEVLVEEV